MEPTTQTNTLPNPDDRQLPHPVGNTSRSSVPTVPRTILNPDDKLLPFPTDLQNNDHKDLKVVGKSFGQKVKAEASEVAHKVKQTAGEVKQELKQHWIHWGIAVGVIAIAAFTIKKILDKE